MRTKPLILIVIALGCGLVASIGITEAIRKQAGSGNDIEMVKILVAKTEISTNDDLTTENVLLEEWPKNRVPEGALMKVEDLQKRYPNQRMYPGDPILEQKLMDTKGDITRKIPEGFRVSPVKVTTDSGGAGLIQPGDRVDVLVYLKKSKEIPKTETRTILGDIEVFAIDSKTIRDTDETGKQFSAKTVSLLVEPSQVETLMLAAELGKIKLVLRRPNDSRDDLTDGADISNILNGVTEQGMSGRQEKGLSGNPLVTKTGLHSGQSGMLEFINGENQKRAGGVFGNLFGAQEDKKTQNTESTNISTDEKTQKEPMKPVWTMSIHSPGGVQSFHWSDKSSLPLQLQGNSGADLLGLGELPADEKDFSREEDLAIEEPPLPDQIKIPDSVKNDPEGAGAHFSLPANIGTNL
ncbi:MAG: Flp pilus assembly protein CpaB [Pirellulaceae bacterium]|nr:Flp pilus assembly protein CpaB [Pirellulaceae bacterium]